MKMLSSYLTTDTDLIIGLSEVRAVVQTQVATILVRAKCVRQRSKKNDPLLFLQYISITLDNWSEQSACASGRSGH